MEVAVVLRLKSCLLLCYIDWQILADVAEGHTPLILFWVRQFKMSRNHVLLFIWEYSSDNSRGMQNVGNP